MVLVANTNTQHQVQEHQLLFERPALPDDVSDQACFFRLSSQTPFEAFKRFCQEMHLDVRVAALAYKYDKDRVRDDPTPLANVRDWEVCVEKGVGAMRNARTRVVTCKLFNQVSPIVSAPSEY